MRELKADIMDGEEPLSKVLGKIQESGTAVMITQNGKYYGLIDDKDIRKVSDPSKAKAINAAVRAPALERDSNMSDTMRAFLAGHFKALPVIEKNRIVGIVTRADVMNEMVKTRMVPKINVAAIMASPLYTVDQDETITVARGIMEKLSVHHLGVTHGKRIVGTLSTFDLSAMLLQPKEGARFLFQSNAESGGSKHVRDLMRERFVSVNPADTLDKAVQTMAGQNISKLTVVEGDKAVGVLTAKDVMKFVLSLVSEGPNVFISGLPEDDMFYYREIKSALKESLQKFKKTFEIGDVNVHFKKGKSTYSMNTHLRVEHGTFVVNSEGYELKDAVSKNLSELKSILNKRKNYKRDKRIQRIVA